VVTCRAADAVAHVDRKELTKMIVRHRTPAASHEAERARASTWQHERVAEQISPATSGRSA
jgi:hypothetical protein